MKRIIIAIILLTLLSVSIYFMYFSDSDLNVRLDTGLRQPIENISNFISDQNNSYQVDKKEEIKEIKESIKKYRQKFLDKCPISDGFDFPVGKPDAKKYYNAQGFKVRNKKYGNLYHLGEDWNGINGGNSDLGDPIYSISDGVVFFTGNLRGGWGNIVRIIHNYGTKNDPKYVESFYAHLDKIFVNEGEIVKRGQQIGKMGNVGGIYYAHLHFEMRNTLWLPIGGGYSNTIFGYIHPTKFIKNHRPSK